MTTSGEPAAAGDTERVWRTPEERFARLAGYGYAPRYVGIGGLRMHYVDVGPRTGQLIVLLHGEPTCSYISIGT